MNEMIRRLNDKSVEAFIMGIELYNKPTINYRIEGFAFFIINAWELMLKAELINRDQSIYFKDSPSRTLSVTDVVKKIYSDEHTRIRLNLEKIIELRNISTHFITEDYEIKYAPLFQSCVLNYVNEIKRFHQIDISDFISQNFLTLVTNYEPISYEQIKLKYPTEIAEKFIQDSNKIDTLSQEYNSDKFAISVHQNLYITRNKENADFIVTLENDSPNKVEIVKELKDPSDTHRYSFNTVIKIVRSRLDRRNIYLHYSKGFNKFILNEFIDFYDVKKNSRFAFKHVIGNQNSFTYSEQLVNFIIEEIEKDPQHFVMSLTNKKR